MLEIRKGRALYEKNTPLKEQVINRMLGRDKFIEQLLHRVELAADETFSVVHLDLRTPVEIVPTFSQPGELKVAAYIIEDEGH